jgi:hypothetical protein
VKDYFIKLDIINKYAAGFDTIGPYRQDIHMNPNHKYLAGINAG